jgi:tRNA wybutosine-synthesizing protein 2
MQGQDLEIGVSSDIIFFPKSGHLNTGIYLGLTYFLSAFCSLHFSRKFHHSSPILPITPNDRQSHLTMTEPFITLLVPREHVKVIKTGLEHHDYFNHRIKITPETVDVGNELPERSRMVITTTIAHTKAETHDEKVLKDAKETILFEIGCALLGKEIGISISTPLNKDRTEPPESKNVVIKALYNALSQLPASLLEVLDITPTFLASTFPESYSVYRPLLLLPSHAFSSPPWTIFLEKYPADSPILAQIWKAMSVSVGCTRLATNAGIPLQNKNSSKDNILRSPTNLTPVYGNFGSSPTKTTMKAPTADDFEQAFWVSTTQNNIHQVWAPMYTMFSRGNIREKTRLLTHPNVASCAGSTVVDLYAGIGYFAFSYARAGLRPILCWELNPWSIEGLRRGAKLNGWSTHTFTFTSLPDLNSSEQDILEWVATVPDVDFLIFQQSNEHASSIISLLTSSSQRIPPIRHINLGLLPSSSLSWPTAIRVIDPKLGGWLHVHENVGVNEIAQKSDEIKCVLQDSLDQGKVERKEEDKGTRKVRVEHVESVKTFAPGVVHVVFDCWIDGAKEV